MQISIRQVTPADAVTITNLSSQLGYPLTVEQIQLNIQAILQSRDHDCFVAVSDDKAVGWIGVAQTILIESLPYCEINGLVIDESYRGKGIGKALIEKAKQWAKEKDNSKIKLRCNIIRTETHLFYQHLGFKDVKKQTNFELDI
jgi:GNAT superfamily N-acetyltransferase